MGIYRRGKVWWICFSYQGRQVRRSAETADRRMAEKIYAKITTHISEGKWFNMDEGSHRTFAELAAKYEAAEFKQLRSWQSVQGYLNGLTNFFGNYKLSEINPAVIDEFKQSRRAEGVTGGTINRQLNIFKRMFNLAKKRWLWVRDVPPVEMEPRADVKRLRYLSYEEFHKLLACCEDWLRPMAIVAAWTGLRQGNVINLKRAQVNLFARTISIEGDEMKNGDQLTIPIAEEAYEALKETMRIVSLKSPYIFHRPDGKPHYKDRIQKAFKRACKKAGIENFRWHDLRHVFASWNRQAGLDIDTLADLMGHKDTRMTRRYAHIGPAHLVNAVEKLENSYHNFITIKEKGSNQNG